MTTLFTIVCKTVIKNSNGVVPTMTRISSGAGDTAITKGRNTVRRYRRCCEGVLDESNRPGRNPKRECMRARRLVSLWIICPPTTSAKATNISSEIIRLAAGIKEGIWDGVVK